jgi:hypothetical protein
MADFERCGKAEYVGSFNVTSGKGEGNESRIAFPKRIEFTLNGTPSVVGSSENPKPRIRSCRRKLFHLWMSLGRIHTSLKLAYKR